MKIFLLVCGLVFSSFAHAIKVGDVELPDTWAVEQDTLVLNGAGMREYGFFRINVYVGALYLPKRDNNAQAILNSSAPRVIHMKMLRNVGREDSVKAWTHYLEANCEAQKPTCAKQSDTFKAALLTFQKLVPDTREGDTQTYVFNDGVAVMLRNGAKLGEVRDPAFARALLASWIGSVPTTEDLRRALLGAFLG